MADVFVDGGTPSSQFDADGNYAGSLLKDGDFELDGYLTGVGLGVYLKELALGPVGYRDQDSPVPNGDALMFGRDYLSGPKWGLTFTANHGLNGAAAHQALSALERAWLGAASRLTPGQTSVLRYRVAGKTRRVYGRPRDIQPDVNALFFTGLARANASFQTADPLTYEDAPRTKELTLQAPSTSTITWPGVWPLIFSQGSDRQSYIADVGGNAPAAFTATFYGPITDPYLVGDGWEIRLKGTLAYDQHVTVDTRARTVLRSDGASLAGALGRGTFLEDARLQPGTAPELRFGGVDPTGTSRCSLEWRAAFYGF